MCHCGSQAPLRQQLTSAWQYTPDQMRALHMAGAAVQVCQACTTVLGWPTISMR